MHNAFREKEKKIVSVFTGIAMFATTVLGNSSVALANYTTSGTGESTTYYDCTFIYHYDAKGEHGTGDESVVYDPSGYATTPGDYTLSGTGDLSYRVSGLQSDQVSATSQERFFWKVSSGKVYNPSDGYTITFSTESATTVEFTPVWADENVNISFDLNGGTDSSETGDLSSAKTLTLDTATNSSDYPSGYAVTYTGFPSTVPTKEGCTFDHWEYTDMYGTETYNAPQTGGSGEITFKLGQSITSDTTYTMKAVYTPSSLPSDNIAVDLGNASDYGVSWTMMTGDTPNWTIQGTQAEVAATGTVSADSGGGNILQIYGIPSVIMDEDAEWPYDANAWLISLDGATKNNGGEVTSSSPIGDDTEYITYTLSESDIASWPITVTYTPVWSTDGGNTVNFYDEDGTLISTATGVLYGDTIELPTNPTKADDLFNTYTFAGWTDGETEDIIENPEKILQASGTIDYYASYTAADRVYDMTITAASDEVTYDGTEQSVSDFDHLTITVDGSDYTYDFNEGESDLTFYFPAEEADENMQLTLSGLSTVAKGTNAGTYNTVTDKSSISIANDDGEDYTNNFSISVTEGTLTIGKAGTMTIAGTDYTGTYDGKAHGSAAVPDVTEGTTVTYSLDGGKTWQSAVPTFTDATASDGVTITAKAVNDNYEDATTTYTIKINPGKVTIDVADASKMYGTEDPDFTGTVSGLVKEGDLGTITYSRNNSDTDVSVGTYSDVITAAYTENDNYTVTINAGDFEITKSDALKVTNSGYSGTYDGKAHGVAAGAAANGKEVDATISYSTDGGVTWSLAYPTVTNVSDSVTVNVKAENDNYVTATNVYKLTVTAAPLTITAQDNSKLVGDTDPALTAVAAGFINEADKTTITYKVTREAGETVGNYAIHVSGAANQGNYSITYVDGTFTIKNVKTAKWTFVVKEGEYEGTTSGSARQSKATEVSFKVTMPAVQPHFTGHTFSGWLCSKDGNVYMPGETAILYYDDADTTVVAFTSTYDLKPIRVIASFDADGGFVAGAEDQYYVMKDESDKEDFTITMPADEPIKDRAFFDGWLCDYDGEMYRPGEELSLSFLDFDYGTTNAINFTAQYTDAKVSEVTFVFGAGSENLEIVQLDREATEFSVTIMAEDPVYDGFFFEGWRNSVDGQLYPSGTEFIYDYDTVKTLEFVSEWTQLISTGDYELSGGTRYKFSGGDKQIASDSTVYSGGAYFYLKSDGVISIQ